LSELAELAETLGLVAEAIAYESENKARKTVLVKLHEAVEKQAAQETSEELTAA
jgi:hypothetical protein